MDEYRENVKKVQKALNQDAAFIQPNPYLVQRVLNAANAECIGKSGISMNRKLLISVVIVALLFSVSALAIVFLRPMEIVEQRVLPMAVESGNYVDVPNFTQEELAAILEVAEENGIYLSDSWYDALKRESGVPKDELIKALAVSEFGDYMSWSIEEQFWFGEVQMRLGYWTANPYRLPTNDELSYDAAYNRIKTYIHEKYGDDVSDRVSYTCSVEYSCVVDENGNAYGEPMWWFCFTPVCLGKTTYEIKMSNSGEITFDQITTYKYETSSDVIDTYSEVYGSVNMWSPEVWASFGEMLNSSKSSGSFLVRCHLGANYCLPPEESISYEEAVNIALDEVDSPYSDIFVVFCCMDRGEPIWKVVVDILYPEDQYSGKYTATWMVEIDCHSGEIRSCCEWNPETDKAAMLYTPFSVYTNLMQQDTNEGSD